MKEIKSVNEVNGKRCTDESIENYINEVIGKYDEIVNFKLYEREMLTMSPFSSTPSYVSEINVVFSVDANYKVLDAIDGTLNQLESDLRTKFKNSRHIFKWHIIWKKYNK